jgi:hypothetical protein
MLSVRNKKEASLKGSLQRYSICAALIAFAIIPSHQTHAETATGTATAEIRQTVAVSQTAPLNFGIINTTSAETITIAPDSSISTLNGTSISGTPAAAAFSASGEPNNAVTISFTNGSIAGAGTPIPINNFAHNAGGSPTFAGDGTLSFAVGADLVINDGQAPGIYTGTYEVAVNYQ